MVQPRHPAVLSHTLAHLTGATPPGVAFSLCTAGGGADLKNFSAPYQRLQQGEGRPAILSTGTDDPANPIHRADSHPTVTVASLVLPNVRGNKEKALARVQLYMRRAAARGAEIMVAPETCLDGYCSYGVSREELLSMAESSEDGPSITRLRTLCRELSVYLCIGFSEVSDGELYNTALLIGRQGETVGRYRKTHGVEAAYKIGDELPVFETEFGKVGILICYDRQPPENARTLAVKGARLLLVPSNGMWGGVNDSLLQTRAYENQSFLVWAHPRDGAVIDPGGRIIAASMTVPGVPNTYSGEGQMPTSTEDDNGWPEAVVREINLSAWQDFVGPLTRTDGGGARRPDLYSSLGVH